MPNPFELNFTEEQLSDFYDAVEQETNSGFDRVSEGMFYATRAFARSLSPVYDAEGNELKEDSPEWESWVSDLNDLIQLPNFSIDGFDAPAYWKKQMEARLTEVSNV